uniref:Elongation of very long chain fatty acids protein n=1 Tax=Culicoides sonorensis TaxID=179676 RepID=A0A336L063_CULSO
MFENTKFARWSRYVFVELADPRTNNWLFIKSPIPTILILTMWLYFVLSWGPKFMANRKPFKMQKLMIIYNAIQVVVSLSLVYPGIYYCYVFGTYNFTCEPVNHSRSPITMKIARSFHWYYLAKISELLDTVFFVLRKKDRQVSFLHVYHHAGMPIISWGLTKYYPGGHLVFSGMLNSMVHVVMYFYYMIAAMGPQYQKYLWWKKYITNMQMIQFALVFLHFSQLLWTDCGFPRWTILFCLPNAVFFYFLFNDFYKKAYQENKKKEEVKQMLLDDKINNNVDQLQCDKEKVQ